MYIASTLHTYVVCINLVKISANICTFEKDFCDWQPQSNNDFAWTRKTGGDFQDCDNECHGPQADYEGSEVTFFINVDAKDTETEKSAAELKSPLIKVAEKPSVCLRFFFNLKVQNFSKKTYC